MLRGSERGWSTRGDACSKVVIIRIILIHYQVEYSSAVTNERVGDIGLVGEP